MRFGTQKPRGGCSADDISDELSPRDRVFMRDRARRRQVQRDHALATTMMEQEEILGTLPEPDRAPTRGVDEAGLKTPTSARKGKKTRNSRR